MQIKIQNARVELSAQTILSSVNFEINDKSRIAVVGRNGCGKTTLLRLIAGQIDISKNESEADSFIAVSGNPKISMLSQITFLDDSVTMLEEIRGAYSEILSLKKRLNIAQAKMEQNQTEQNIKNYTNLLDTFTNLGGFYYEREYESAIKHFGFSQEDKNKPLSDFSGGQRTKIAFLKLLLSKPDVLLLDEPTNHLDMYAVEWLEDYLKAYKKSFVIVSHDRMFLDNVAETVYEIEHGKTYKYNGNYTHFVEAKRVLRQQQQKDFIAQQKEIERLEGLVDRFRYKATKAAMAQSKLKQIEKLDVLEAPEHYDNRVFKANFTPEDLGVKNMLEVNELAVGYDRPLSTISIKVELGDKIGIVGGNGLGKSTFIRTLMGYVKALSGQYKFATRAKIGYFDQQMAEYVSDKTVLDDYMSNFPSISEFEARCDLGAFMFSGDDVFKAVKVLSGGERVRLALCKIFKQKPNFLILDEPTNHMDILGKEALEEMLSSYEGTVIFVSHDRYFIKKIATKVLDFCKGRTQLFHFGYEEYLKKHKETISEESFEIKPKKEKKVYITPAKEKAKRERAIKKVEENIEAIEKELSNIQEELSKPQNMSDYILLSELSEKSKQLEQELEKKLAEWEDLSILYDS